MATNASQSSQDFVLAFNACHSPKDVLKLVQGFANRAFTAFISVGSDSVQVTCTTLAGVLMQECAFPIDATISDLEATFRHQTIGDISTTCVAFLADDGAILNSAGYLRNHLRLTVKASLSPDDVGKILYKAGDTVSVELLGQCFIQWQDFWRQLTMSYPENFVCFAGMDIVKALRSYLWRFRLCGGHLAAIERILDGFARSYFNLNSAKVQQIVVNEVEIESCKACDDDSETEPEDGKSEQSQSCWHAGVSGWYVQQPLSGPKLLPCCISCGELDGENEDLDVCQGCSIVHFCRGCRRSASRYGHAVVGQVGYGRACVAAKRQAGSLGRDGKITYQRSMNQTTMTSVVSAKDLCWTAVSPFRDQDSVMLLAFAIIMLSTDLHSISVRKTKKHEFIKQNRGVNGGTNLPGDFLAKIYDDIHQEELKMHP